MYIPEHFSQSDTQQLLALIRSSSFGMLIHAEETLATVSHVPFLLGDDQQLTLYCHLARANTQWQAVARQPQVLVVFQGPHGYISPSWYQNPGVPTWNYTAVHCYGTARILEQEEQKRQLVEALTAEHEQRQFKPWSAEYPDGMLQAIVGIEIRVDDIQGKYKLSQNRPVVDQEGVIQALSNAGDENSQAVAKLMQELHDQK